MYIQSLYGVNLWDLAYLYVVLEGQIRYLCDSIYLVCNVCYSNPNIWYKISQALLYWWLMYKYKYPFS